MLAKKFGRNVSGRPSSVRSRTYSLELGPGVPPREVGVGLAEAGLRKRRHHRRTREGLGQEDHVGVSRLHVPDQPLPERDRLRVRVVDPERPHAVGDPEEHDIAERRPEALPVLRLEVDVVDVLVALRRVLGVLQRPVRPVVEPLRVLDEPRVVRRALDREVERQIEPELARTLDEPIEVGERSELGVHGGVAAPVGADRPRAARIARRRRSGSCSGPCDGYGRSDGWAAGRRRRSRARRAAAAPRRHRRSRRTIAGTARTRRRTAPAPVRRRARAAAQAPVPRAAPRHRPRRGRGRAPPRGSATAARRGARPPTARCSGRPAPPAPSARAPTARRRAGRSRRRSCTARRRAGRPRRSPARDRCRAARAGSPPTCGRPAGGRAAPREGRRDRRRRSSP